MNFRKLILHDLRCGLLRRRFLLVPLLLAFPFMEYSSWAIATGTKGTWMDFMLFLFKGNEVLNLSELVQFLTQISIPLPWLLIMGAGLVLNLDYLLHDLSLTGQQIMIRSGNRILWFLSKCIWSVLSTALYMILLAVSGCVYLLMFGGKLSLCATPEMMLTTLGALTIPEMRITQALIIGILLPFLTLASIHILQMTLCIFVKPIISFLVCLGLLVLAIYCPVPWILGNGAMTIRSIYFEGGCIMPLNAGMWACFVMIGCIFLGCWGFKRSDLIPQET